MAAGQETVPAPMELPVHDVVNTGQETFRQGGGQAGFINVCLVREAGCQPWGFRLQGGKDRGLPFQLLKVSQQPGRPQKYQSSGVNYIGYFCIFIWGFHFSPDASQG